MQKPRNELTFLSHVQRGRFDEMVEELPGFKLVLRAVGGTGQMESID